MEKKGGVYYVPCKVNGLALKFIFDTGASDVSISLSEALFMLKNGYMEQTDLRGTEYYRIANGEIAEGTKLLIRKIEIGNKTLTNIEASIVHSLDAPLLLGQSVMERFGKFTVDYANNTISIDNSNVNLNIISTNQLPKMNSNPILNIIENPVECIDLNGNNYKTIKIGNQIWMAENLKVTKFKNGDVIRQAKNIDEWINSGIMKEPVWCYYEYNNSNDILYGKLYNWYAVIDKRGLAPDGCVVVLLLLC